MQPANAVIVSDGLNVDGSKGLRLLRLLRRKSNMETATGCVYVCVTVYVCDIKKLKLVKFFVGNPSQNYGVSPKYGVIQFYLQPGHKQAQ